MILKRLAIFFVLFISSSGVHAELYKWTDEHGKVHYSDKEPQKEQQLEPESITLEQSRKASPRAQQIGNVIIRPYEKSARTLHLLDTIYYWKKASEVGRSAKLGTYQSGKACTSRGAIKTPDVFIHHKYLLPEEHSLTRHIAQVINGLDYQASRTNRYELLQKLRKSGGLSLHSEVIDLDINTCAPGNHYGKTVFEPEKISSGRFTKNRIRIKVRWQLKTNRDQDLLYETETDGAYNGWNKNTSANQAILFAMESALLSLFSDKSFIDHILVKEEAIELVSESEQYNSISAQKNKQYKRLFLSLNTEDWKQQADPASAVGRLLFGDKCTASKPLQLLDVTSKSKLSLPRQSEYEQAVINRVKPLGYQMHPLVNSLTSLKDDQSSLKLEGELLAWELELCAPSLPASSKYKSIDNIPSRKLTRIRAKVTVKWMLRTLDDRSIVYQSRTAVTAGDLLTDGKHSEILQNAMGDAAAKLFSEVAFVDKLVVDKTIARITGEAFDTGMINTAQPIIKPQDAQMSALFVVTDPNIWSEMEIDSSIGLYAFSDECIEIQRKTWPQAFNDYPRLFPKNSAISNAQASIINSLGYQHRISDQKNVLNMKRKLGGFSLHAKLKRLRYDSCAANIQQAEKLSSKVSSKQYNRHRVIVDIDWELYDQEHRHVVFNRVTQGAADSWQINSEGKQVVLEAVENATRLLFSSQDLVNLLIKNRVEEEQDRSLFDKLLTGIGFGSDADDQEQAGSPAVKIRNNYMAKAKLSQALVDLTAIKLPMTEYYMSYGEWPGSLEDINLSQDLIANSRELSYVSIDAGGSIVGELDQAFGSGMLIRFSPQQNQNNYNIRWQCTSNLPASMLPNPCEHSPY